MSQQTNLFDFENTTPKENTSPLIIKSNSKKEKSSTDQINKKIQKIDKLKKKFAKVEEDLKKIKQSYLKFVSPEEKKLLLAKAEFVIKLHTRWKEKGFTQWQRELMEDIILKECEFLYNHDYESEEITKIHDHILEDQKQRIDPFEKDIMNDMAKDMLKNFGIDIDDDEDFDIDDFDPSKSDSFKNFKEKQEQSEKEAANNFKKEKVLNTDKQFQKLYKSLVKKAHPDLVIDKTEKEKREILMKKLSEVWEERNYYELLILKAEIEKDGATDIEIDETQSKSLIIQLNNEIRDWEAKIMYFKRFDEENSFYFKNFDHRTENTLKQKIHKYNTYLQNELETVISYNENLKTKVSTKSFLKNSRKDYEDDDDFFFPIFD